MNVSEVKVKLVSDKTDKLKAFCSITIDREFVIRDIKVIQGTKGCFIAMPSRKLVDRCPACGGKNHLRATHCNGCGAPLGENRVPHDPAGRAKLHVDIAHPINSACRERLQQCILEAYQKEVERSGQPGYVAPADEEVFADADVDVEDARAPAPAHAAPAVHAAPPPPPPAPPAPHAAPPPPPPPPPVPGKEDSFSDGIL